MREATCPAVAGTGINDNDDNSDNDNNDDNDNAGTSHEYLVTRRRTTTSCTETTVAREHTEKCTVGTNIITNIYTCII